MIFRVKGFKLICSITGNSCHIVNRIAIIIGVVDLNLELLVTVIQSTDSSSALLVVVVSI